MMGYIPGEGTCLCSADRVGGCHRTGARFLWVWSCFGETNPDTAPVSPVSSFTLVRKPRKSLHFCSSGKCAIIEPRLPEYDWNPTRIMTIKGLPVGVEPQICSSPSGPRSGDERGLGGGTFFRREIMKNEGMSMLFEKHTRAGLEALGNMISSAPGSVETCRNRKFAPER